MVCAYFIQRCIAETLLYLQKKNSKEWKVHSIHNSYIHIHKVKVGNALKKERKGIHMG